MKLAQVNQKGTDIKKHTSQVSCQKLPFHNRLCISSWIHTGRPYFLEFSEIVEDESQQIENNSSRRTTQAGHSTHVKGSKMDSK